MFIFVPFIYIPLCFYFICPILRLSKHNLPIYIPLCFYFIRERREEYEHYVDIYIPLCFYFICLQLDQNSEYPDLHSTMLLLYPTGKTTVFDAFTIYIPLCFYFIFRRRFRSLRRFLIYIPLCFYFIVVSWTLRLMQRQFTFHYASTLSMPCGMSAPHLHLIYIPLCFYFINERLLGDCGHYDIYIPLCFYFISAAGSSRP